MNGRKLLLSLTVALAACSSATPAPAKPVVAAPADGVPWDHYIAGLKARIDSEDCATLQIEFDNADRNGGNSALMGYIDGVMQKGGCYK